MKNGLKRMSAGLAVVAATAAAGVVLTAGPSSAVTIVKEYPYTATGARQCQIDLKTAPAGYYCGLIYRPMGYALMHN
ncbi:hypothetical protein [Sphaerisporangium fuscum]|uniref:hypothetical protein n=1 Tax=Sphaerisporangium fuscum TaxID=2835868 RepID=UPI001BDC8B4E|nr:hypothetical protein [Sphaerisporangium fuscum]